MMDVAPSREELRIKSAINSPLSLTLCRNKKSARPVHWPSLFILSPDSVLARHLAWAGLQDHFLQSHVGQQLPPGAGP